MLQLLVLVIAHHLIVTFAKNNFLILSECPIYGINGSFGSSEKKLVLMLLKKIPNFVWACIIMPIIVICSLMENKSLN